MVCQWCLIFDKIWYKHTFLVCVIHAHGRKFMKYRNKEKSKNNSRDNTVTILEYSYFSTSLLCIFIGYIYAYKMYIFKILD